MCVYTDQINICLYNVYSHIVLYLSCWYSHTTFGDIPIIVDLETCIICTRGNWEETKQVDFYWPKPADKHIYSSIWVTIWWCFRTIIACTFSVSSELAGSAFYHWMMKLIGLLNNVLLLLMCDHHKQVIGNVKRKHLCSETSTHISNIPQLVGATLSNFEATYTWFGYL